MSSRDHRKAGRQPLPFECVALLLQGGGALGSYQAGVYQALAEANLPPSWVAGISIGAINSALIAGNAPENRVAQLRRFWEQITTPRTILDMPSMVDSKLFSGDAARSFMAKMSATGTILAGAAGFFEPRLPPPSLYPAGAPEATSYYDTSNLKSTLESLVDFDRINDGDVRLSVGAVNIRSGNFVYFDTTTHKIIPEHIMASGALPPGFPGIEIEGEFYWDGGLVSNTPLHWVVSHEPPVHTLAFQVDLWSSRGELPKTLDEVGTRTKEIQFSSRTRAASNQLKQSQRTQAALATLLSKLPPELRNLPESKLLRAELEHKAFNLIQLIYRSKNYEGNTKDYEFSRRTMEEHWSAGYNDAIRTLRHPEVLQRHDPAKNDGLFTFDLAVNGRE